MSRKATRRNASRTVMIQSLEPRQLMAANTGLFFAPIGELSGMPSGTPAQAYADLNGDGKMDMIRSSGIAPNATAVWLGNGTGGFANPVFYPGGSNCQRILVSDVTGDGKLDVLHLNANQNSITVLRGLGDGTLVLHTEVALGAMTPLDAALVDWTRDGVLDLVVSGYDGFALRGRIGTLVGNPGGTFGSLTIISPSIQTDFTAPLGIASGDFNGDTWPDFVVTHQNTQRGYQLYLNNQDGTTFDRQQIQILGSDVPGWITTADFNQDGWTDFAFTCTSSEYGASFPAHDLTIAMNNANPGVPTFTMSHHVVDTDRDYAVSQAVGVTVADMDGDGKQDILFGGTQTTSPFSAFVRILRGDDAGNFTPARKQEMSVGVGRIGVPDLNNDGAPDLMVTTGGSVSMSRMLANFTSIFFNMSPSKVYDGEPASVGAEVRRTVSGVLPITSSTWYTASDPNTPIPAPTNAGNYVVHAHFAGDANNPPATASMSFAITPAASTVTVNVPFLLTYTGNPATVTATAHGLQGVLLGSASVEYFLASDPTFSNPVTPINVGTYVARGTYAGGGNYLGSTGTGVFDIIGVTPTVNVSIPTHNPFTGAPVQATGSVIGVNGEFLGTPSFTYYLNTDFGLTNPLPGAPSAQGGYQVYARFQGSGNYGYAEDFRNFFIIAPESLVVTTIEDQLDANASPALGGTSLREALRYAEQKPGADTITFAPELAGQTITLLNGWNGAADDTALRINSDVTIDGGANGTVIHLSSATPRRSMANLGNTTLRNLTLSGGNLAGVQDGGAIWSNSSLTIENCRFTGNQATMGGAIVSSGQLSVTHSTFDHNSATSFGGAIENFGTLNISGSTFEANHAGYDGGAVHSAINSVALGIANSTFVGNTAQIASAITTAAASNQWDHLTIVDNIAQPGGAALDIYEASVLLRNCIIARNINDGALTTLGNGTGHFTAGSTNNLVAGGGWTGLNPAANHLNVDIGSLKIGAIADNGGPTRTIALLPGSPAINAAASIAGITTDQRGVTRPQGSAADIGAFERQATSATLQTAAYESETRQAVTFGFNGDASVTFSRQAIAIQNLTTGQPVGPEVGTLSFDPTGQNATLLLTNLLADGDYRVTVGTTTLDFTVFAGDANGDRSVTIADFAILAGNFNQPGTFSQGDFNYDGIANIADFAILAGKFNTSLPAPGARTGSDLQHRSAGQKRFVGSIFGDRSVAELLVADDAAHDN